MAYKFKQVLVFKHDAANFIKDEDFEHLVDTSNSGLLLYDCENECIVRYEANCWDISNEFDAFLAGFTYLGEEVSVDYEIIVLNENERLYSFSDAIVHLKGVN